MIDKDCILAKIDELDSYLLDQSHINKIKKLNVSIVYLFGSYAEKKNHSLSDIDIGIVFNDKLNTSQDMSNIYRCF